MSNLLPDLSGLNTLARIVGSPVVASNIAMRGALMLAGGVGMALGLAIAAFGTDGAKKAVKAGVEAGAAVATDGASVAATGAAKAAKGVANAG